MKAAGGPVEMSENEGSMEWDGKMEWRVAEGRREDGREH